MVNNRKESSNLFKPGKHKRIPRFAMSIDTIIAIIVFGLGIYHSTQPNQAWRSGTIEVLASVLLLIAAYLVHWPKAMAINLIVAVLSCSLGVRHVIHGGGWKSGITELFLAIVLIAVTSLIYNFGKVKKVR